MRDPGPIMFRAAGPTGALGCGLALVFLGLFLLTPVAVFLIKGIGWALIVIGILLSALALWAWFRRRGL
ncbi:MAG: hypothetical protein F4X64_10540 [Chloroflexi bacterium]|nr:hypothetical protein [Chloroflexota bacterium]